MKTNERRFMNLKLGDVRNSLDSLKKLLGTDLPVKVSYKLSKIVKKVNSEIKELEDKRIELIKQYGELKDEKIEVKPENLVLFMSELQTLLDLEIDLDIQPIKLDELGDIKFSAVDLADLEKFIVE